MRLSFQKGKEFGITTRSDCGRVGRGQEKGGVGVGVLDIVWFFGPGSDVIHINFEEYKTQ